MSRGYSALFTDADNTLWDTNAVFKHAQLLLMREVLKVVKPAHHSHESDALGYLRTIDQKIAAGHPDRLSYPPKLLARGLALALLGNSTDDAVKKVLRFTRLDSKLDRPVEHYLNALLEIPSLRPGVSKTIPVASTLAKITVVTEGDLNRCRLLLEKHNLEKFVTEIISGNKDRQLFANLASRYTTHKLIMVGDQLDRDIEPPKLAGFFTVWFPGGFSPYWLTGAGSSADFTIDRYDQVLALLA